VSDVDWGPGDYIVSEDNNFGCTGIHKYHYGASHMVSNELIDPAPVSWAESTRLAWVLWEDFIYPQGVYAGQTIYVSTSNILRFVLAVNVSIGFPGLYHYHEQKASIHCREPVDPGMVKLSLQLDSTFDRYVEVRVLIIGVDYWVT
jgi:hypothetical protein